jgi:hypothetical protein
VSSIVVAEALLGHLLLETESAVARRLQRKIGEFAASRSSDGDDFV